MTWRLPVISFGDLPKLSRADFGENEVDAVFPALRAGPKRVEWFDAFMIEKKLLNDIDINSIIDDFVSKMLEEIL